MTGRLFIAAVRPSGRQAGGRAGGERGEERGRDARRGEAGGAHRSVSGWLAGRGPRPHGSALRPG